MPRKHGLEWPPDPHQVGSGILFTILVAGCYVLFFPFVEDRPTRWALIAAYGLVVTTTLALNLITSRIDPSDAGLRCHATNGEFYCSLCKVNVERRSKHCKTCDRCTEGFDHHCKWLNNCIGKRNYKPFFALVTLTLTMLLFQLAVGIYLFARSFYDKKDTARIVKNTYEGYVNYVGWQVALAVYIVVVAASIFMLGELFTFHVVLVYKGMTTYDYIVFQREQRTLKEAEALEEGRPPSAKFSFWKPKKVHDESSAQKAAKSKKTKVGINPCAACATPTPAHAANSQASQSTAHNNSKPHFASSTEADKSAFGAPARAKHTFQGSPHNSYLGSHQQTGVSRAKDLELQKPYSNSDTRSHSVLTGAKNFSGASADGGGCVETLQEAAAPAHIPGANNGSWQGCAAPQQASQGGGANHDRTADLMPGTTEPFHDNPIAAAVRGGSYASNGMFNSQTVGNHAHPLPQLRGLRGASASSDLSPRPGMSPRDGSLTAGHLTGGSLSPARLSPRGGSLTAGEPSPRGSLTTGRLPPIPRAPIAAM